MKGTAFREADNFWGIKTGDEKELTVSTVYGHLLPKNIGDIVEFEEVNVFGLKPEEGETLYAKIIKIYDSRFTDVISMGDKVVAYISVVDEKGEEIHKIKSYNNLTKEAEIFDFLDVEGEKPEWKTKNVVLTGSRIVFRKTSTPENKDY